MTVPFKERRAFERVGSKATLAFTMDREPNKKFTAISKNLSIKSIGFETDAPLEVGDRISIELQTIFGPVAISAVVMRKNDLVVGCLFADMSLEAASKINSWLFPPFEP